MSAPTFAQMKENLRAAGLTAEELRGSLAKRREYKAGLHPDDTGNISEAIRSISAHEIVLAEIDGAAKR